MGYQRGDAVAFVHTRSTFIVGGPIENHQEIVMATVTSVTRGKQFDSIDEARAELAQFKIKKEVNA